MSFVAVLGAGPIGATLAHKLAARERVREIRLIDADERIAAGKALDITQSAPVEQFSTRVVASTDLARAAGAAAIVIADHASGKGAHAGEAGLAAIRQLAALGIDAPLVFAGTDQLELMARCVDELHVRPARIVGAAPAALEAGLCAIAGLALDVSGVEVSLRVVGVPPRQAVVTWEEASVSGQPIRAQLPPHEIGALSARIPGLWPPGPYALGSAGARVVEAIVTTARRRYSCFVWLGRGRVAAMPVELDAGGVRRVHEPALTPQERTRLDIAIGG
jgi:malate dehydrogenase